MSIHIHSTKRKNRCQLQGRRGLTNRGYMNVCTHLSCAALILMRYHITSKFEYRMRNAFRI